MKQSGGYVIQKGISIGWKSQIKQKEKAARSAAKKALINIQIIIKKRPSVSAASMNALKNTKFKAAPEI